MKELEQLIDRSWPRAKWQGTRLLLAVSGGADSVAMLRALVQLSPSSELLAVAHFNHGWRGTESEADEQFVRDLCDQLSLRCFIGRADAVQGPPIPQTEEGAREARYEFLSATAYSIGARYVVTAHTANDRVETLLHNLFRGTGMSGVRGIRQFRPLGAELVLCRPMLEATRQQVLTYLNEVTQAYREDSSNRDLGYRRNAIRQAILPTIREHYGHDVDQRILSFSELAAESEAEFSEMASQALTEAERQARDAEQNGQLPALSRTMFALPTQPKLAAAWPVVRQALVYVWMDRGWPLVKMDRRHWETIRSSYQSSPSEPQTESSVEVDLPAEGSWNPRVACNLPGNLQLLTCGSWLVFQSPPRDQSRSSQTGA